MAKKEDRDEHWKDLLCPLSVRREVLLRLLLNIVKGATCFEDIKTVGGIIHLTYKAACHALGLLIGDNEWHECLHEAVVWATGTQLRNLFVTILLFCEVSDPKDLWEKPWEALSDDIIHRQRQRLGISNLSLNEEQLQAYALYEIEQLLNRENRSLINYHEIPLPDAALLQDSRNRMLLEEQNYDTQSLARNACDLEHGLNTEQRHVYDNILEAMYHSTGKLFFVYGSGGTRKTYLWKALISKLRSEEHIVLAVASSGITTLLLPSRRTAHSRFKIPMNLNENSCCSIEQGSNLAELINKTKLIIWDEARMVHRHAFEAVDRTLRDIMQLSDQTTKDKVFGGKIVVLGGDFRHILPVVPKGGRVDIVDASVSKSNTIWPHCIIHTLKTNMRLRKSNIHDLVALSKWVLDMGDGQITATTK